MAAYHGDCVEVPRAGLCIVALMPDDEMDPSTTNLEIEALRILATGPDEAIIGFKMEDVDSSNELSVFFKAKAFEKASRLFAMDVAMRDVWYGGGELWAIDGRKLHRFGGTLKKPASSKELPIDASAIAGRAPNDLYVVGDGVAHFDGKKWTKLSTNVNALTCISVHGDVAYAAGDDGALVEIAGGKVRSVEAPAREGIDFTAIHIDGSGRLSVGGKRFALQGPPGKLAVSKLPKDIAVVTSIGEHAGKIYWAAVGDGDGFGLFVQSGKQLEMVDARITGTLSSTDRFLYVAGDSGVLRFDGNEWKILALDFDDDKELWSLESVGVDVLDD